MKALPTLIQAHLRRLAMVAFCVGLTACGPATLPPGDQIVDAEEAANRSVHRFNVSLDGGLVSRVSDAYGETVPEPVRTGVSNFASNLSQPSYVLNNLLQFRIGQATQNTLRFAINSTIGLGGLLDPATALGVPAEETDFGETMHIYGLPEGDYVVLPFLGPSTTRDTVGRVVDLAINPVRLLIEPPASNYAAGGRVFATLGARYDFRETLDDLYYDSADSYLAMRSLYLQARRFELRGPDDTYEDPYASAAPAVSDPSYDPLLDPYFDPYAQ